MEQDISDRAAKTDVRLPVIETYVFQANQVEIFETDRGSSANFVARVCAFIHGVIFHILREEKRGLAQTEVSLRTLYLPQ